MVLAMQLARDEEADRPGEILTHFDLTREAVADKDAEEGHGKKWRRDNLEHRAQ